MLRTRNDQHHQKNPNEGELFPYSASPLLSANERLPEGTLPPTEDEYVREALALYASTPGTSGQIRPADRVTAAQLFKRGVSITAVANALVLGSARRLVRSKNAPPLNMVQSLAYFLRLIDEVLEMKVGPEYFAHLRRRIKVTLGRSN